MTSFNSRLWEETAITNSQNPILPGKLVGALAEPIKQFELNVDNRIVLYMRTPLSIKLYLS